MPLIHTIPQNHCVIIERFGKFSKVQNHGLNFCIPILDKVKQFPEWGGVCNKKGYFIELSEQQTDTIPRQCQTMDNVTVIADSVVYWRITDPVKAVYDVDILPKSVADSALNALRSNIGNFTLDKLLSEREKLNELVAAQLSAVAKKWGVIITRAEIQEIKYDTSTHEAMLQEMTAERKKRALIAEAEGESNAILLIAESKAKAAAIEAKGEAAAIKTIAQAEGDYLKTLSETVDHKIAGQILVAQKFLNNLESMSKNDSHKIFIPNDLSSFISISDNNSNS